MNNEIDSGYTVTVGVNIKIGSVKMIRDLNIQVVGSTKEVNLSAVCKVGNFIPAYLKN